MAGIYIHIPFCKQACHYCDFHFSISLKKKDALIDAICKELVLRKLEISEPVQTIYFGGGTPSLLAAEELEHILTAVHQNYNISEVPEITIEINPDDLFSKTSTAEVYLAALKKTGINRLSIGIQSFDEQDLKFMNRAHDATEALDSVEIAKKHFNNISIDLIYGIPEMSNERWLENVHKAISLDIPHISCYALTVEPKTALKTFIEKGIVPPVNDEVAQEHHALLIEATENAGFENYEFSNFGKPGRYSQNNMAYWQGKPYLGIGPSAHSYSGTERSWNLANNTGYIKAIQAENLPLERESLSTKDQYNEYVMTRLRTQNGISIQEIQTSFGQKFVDYLLTQSKGHLDAQRLFLEDDRLTVTKKGKFLSDGIASDLFLIELA